MSISSVIKSSKSFEISSARTILALILLVILRNGHRMIVPSNAVSFQP